MATRSSGRFCAQVLTCTVAAWTPPASRVGRWSQRPMLPDTSCTMTVSRGSSHGETQAGSDSGVSPVSTRSGDGGLTNIRPTKASRTRLMDIRNFRPFFMVQSSSNSREGHT